MVDYKSYKPLILKEIQDLHRIEVYEAGGGYQNLRKALVMKPEEIVGEVKKSGLRGRGGAGFPTGMKWGFVGKAKPRYLAVNGDESEPGSFKDRQIFEFNPHQLIEGCLISCYALDVETCYIYIRGEYAKWIDIVETALAEARQKGYVGKNILGKDFSAEIYVHRGAGAYICGEESALMNSIEGKRAYPRLKPPFPAVVGLWGQPTVINNVETITNIPLIIEIGAEAYSKIGAPDHPGPMLYGLSGHVNKPGIYEYPSGMAITDLIYDIGGGIRGGKKLKAVIPGGSSMPILRADMIEGVTMNADSLKKAGTSIGTAGMIIMDEDTDIVAAIARLTHFYHHESCGQCTPCREGTGWIEHIYKKFLRDEAEPRDIDLLLSLCKQIEQRTICALADGAAWPVRFSIERFREEYEKHCKTPESRGWNYKMKAVSGV
ncbi:NADH-quinone oxidoreductase, F subunit [Chloroherpeton thalassium ATCC 35110]|uniref:NADH-quinone oxidoreductase subunit F n=1 Tax=Chloroherpeton thalassium (strain ATCC 35110 / GB-78) TaxID=517418 RepID=B3QUW0_CHLT3|nr:NADH-quinone oxidoreductase subunit NuoF [Chloroherpeton thalassium]ACF14461.1 NADH-quinone oxidoreductase, F subunit [Chloroherpeton thalassium ATCC 35110]